MTRGRRKDMTIPPSRALLQQRDYRARKAQYLADLEVRVKKAEEENILLRRELESLQAKLKAALPPQAQSPYGPEVAAASSDLMHHLTIAAASITRFQQLAFYPGPAGSGPNSGSGPAPHVNRTPITLATPTYTPSPVAPPHALSVSPRIELPPLALSPPHRHRSAECERDRERERERELERPYPSREPLPSVYPHRSLPSTVMGPAPIQSQHQHQRQQVSPAPRFPGPNDSDCCGGYVDCRGLVEDEDESMDEDDDSRSRSQSQSRVTQRMSDVRSTTSSSSGPEDNGGSPHSQHSHSVGTQ